MCSPVNEKDAKSILSLQMPLVFTALYKESSKATFKHQNSERKVFAIDPT